MLSSVQKRDGVGQWGGPGHLYRRGHSINQLVLKDDYGGEGGREVDHGHASKSRRWLTGVQREICGCPGPNIYENPWLDTPSHSCLSILFFTGCLPTYREIRWVPGHLQDLLCPLVARHWVWQGNHQTSAHPYLYVSNGDSFHYNLYFVVTPSTLLELTKLAKIKLKHDHQILMLSSLLVINFDTAIACRMFIILVDCQLFH